MATKNATFTSVVEVDLGGRPWSNVSNTIDGNIATSAAVPAVSGTSNPLRFGIAGMGLNLPANAVVTAISVSVRAVAVGGA